MRVIIAERLGGPEVLSVAEREAPRPGPGQVVVEVAAAGVNFADIYQREGVGGYRFELPFVPGQEGAGTVADVGEGVTGLAVGDRVAWAGGRGGYAEQIVLPADRAIPVPAGISLQVAAAVILQGLTAHYLVTGTYQVRDGDVTVVHAAAGGVGSGAVQLGKAAGARVIGVVGGPAKAEVAAALGADVVIDRTRENVIEVVKSVTGGNGADVVYDPVGGDAFAQSIKCIAFEGRIVIVGFASGQIPSAALNHALVKNYSILGLHWGLYQTKDPALIRECHAQLVKLAADGLIKPLIGERLGLADVPAGVQRLADGETIGRIVFQP